VPGQPLQPAGRGQAVRVQEGDQLGAGGPQPGVARGGRPARVLVPDHPGAGRHRRDRGRFRGTVVDHDHRAARRRRVGAQRGQQPGEPVGPVLDRHHHRHTGGRRRPHLRVGDPGVQQPGGQRRGTGVGHLDPVAHQQRPGSRGEPQLTERGAAEQRRPAVAPLGAGGQPDDEPVGQPVRRRRGDGHQPASTVSVVVSVISGA
jgi:hypothetical protein